MSRIWLSSVLHFCVANVVMSITLLWVTASNYITLTRCKIGLDKLVDFDWSFDWQVIGFGLGKWLTFQMLMRRNGYIWKFFSLFRSLWQPQTSHNLLVCVSNQLKLLTWNVQLHCVITISLFLRRWRTKNYLLFVLVFTYECVFSI